MKSFANTNRRLAKRYDEWTIAMHYANSTQRTYRKCIRVFIEFSGDKSIASATHADIRRFIAKMSQDGASLSMVYRALGVLRAFYDFLNLGGVVSYVAPRFIRLRRPWWNSPAPLTEPQVQKLIAATLTSRERCLVEFLYATGCRLSEARHLRVENIDLVARTARVVGKLGKARIVLLTPEATQALREYIGERNKGFAFREERFSPTGCLFNREGTWKSIWKDYSGRGRGRRRSRVLGRVDELSCEEARKMHEDRMAKCKLNPRDKMRALSKMALQQVIKRVAARARLKNVTPHTLRRTFATHLHHHGAPVEIIQALMGHVWIQTTMKYTRISPDRLVSTFDHCHPRGQLDAQTSP
jgi:site-specific recombinase XerD